MWTISQKRLRDFWEQHPDAELPLRQWYKVAAKASWSNLVDVRRIYPHADAVTLPHRATMTVFNIGGNKYRLITRIDYQRHKVYVKQVLTHAEYSQDAWKGQL